MLYLARPIQIKDPACLACHSVPAAAPASMIKLYGESNGFGWKHQEIVGAQVVVGADGAADQERQRRLHHLHGLARGDLRGDLHRAEHHAVADDHPPDRAACPHAADKISTGDFDVPEFGDGGSDEIGALGTSFNRMRRSLQKALKLIER